MKANMTKLISSAAAVLAVGSSAFAQTTTKACPPSSGCTYEQGYGLCGDKFPAAYNAPARIDVQCSWDFFLSASFLYWHVDQEGMDLGWLYDTASSAPINESVIIQNFEFKPGFKAAIGMDFDYDNWVGALEYTWLHQSTSKSATPGTGQTIAINNWLNGTSAYTTLSSKWKCHVDLLDLTLSRPYYEGRKLTILPFGGLRGAWIRQALRMNATYSSLVQHSHTNSHCWAVGPRAGAAAHWLLGYGFRIEGDMSGSILFTQYRAGHHEKTSPTASSDVYHLKYHDYDTLRPMADMSVGLGWGSYFDHQNYHFDLLATYDFNVMWGQNMMRALVDTYQTGAAFEPADLHIQGLTVTARFDF